jgi:hypothetical protein
VFDSSHAGPHLQRLQLWSKRKLLLLAPLPSSLTYLDLYNVQLHCNLQPHTACLGPTRLQRLELKFSSNAENGQLNFGCAALQPSWLGGVEAGIRGPDRLVPRTEAHPTHTRVWHLSHMRHERRP